VKLSLKELNQKQATYSESSKSRRPDWQQGLYPLAEPFGGRPEFAFVMPEPLFIYRKRVFV